MVALQIRDVPDDVRDRLAELARSRGQSLQAYLLALVTRDADRANNLALLSRFADRTDDNRATSAGPADVAEQIRRRQRPHARGAHRPSDAGDQRRDNVIVIDASVLAGALTDDGRFGQACRAELAKDAHWAAPDHLVVEAFSGIRGLQRLSLAPGLRCDLLVIER